MAEYDSDETFCSLFEERESSENENVTRYPRRQRKKISRYTNEIPLPKPSKRGPKQKNSKSVGTSPFKNKQKGWNDSMAYLSRNDLILEKIMSLKYQMIKCKNWCKVMLDISTFHTTMLEGITERLKNCEVESLMKATEKKRALNENKKAETIRNTGLKPQTATLTEGSKPDNVKNKKKKKAEKSNDSVSSSTKKSASKGRRKLLNLNKLEETCELSSANVHRSENDTQETYLSQCLNNNAPIYLKTTPTLTPIPKSYFNDSQLNDDAWKNNLSQLSVSNTVNAYNESECLIPMSKNSATENNIDSTTSGTFNRNKSVAIKDPDFWNNPNAKIPQEWLLDFNDW